MNFGEWIRRTMADKRIAEEEAYTRAGMTQPNWSRLVNNPPKQPRKSTMQSVALALDEPLCNVMAAAGYNDNLDADMRLARRLEPILMQVAPSARPKIEEAIVQVTRAMVGVSPN